MHEIITIYNNYSGLVQFSIVISTEIYRHASNLIRFAHTAVAATKLPRLNVSRSSAKSQFRFCRTLFAQSVRAAYTLSSSEPAAISRLINELNHKRERGSNLAKKREGGGKREKVEIRAVGVSNLNPYVHLPYHFQTNITGCASFIGTHGTNAPDLSSRRHSLVLVLCH